MDKDFIIIILEKIRTNTLDSKSFSILFIEYCKEHNKKESDILKLLSMVSKKGILTIFIVPILTYYQKKFNITKLSYLNNIIAYY